jgi:hypothetical protein
MQPATQYAKSGDLHTACQAFGDGPINPVLVPGFVSNVQSYWEYFANVTHEIIT